MLSRGHAGRVSDDGPGGALHADVLRVVDEVMRLPYVWPAPPDAAAAAAAGAGSCASKHALLATRLAALGVTSRPLFVVGPLVPHVLAADPAIAPGVGLVEVHELLTVSMPGIGPVRVDVTWDPPLVARGLPGTTGWDGTTDMAVAVGEGTPAWAPDPTRLREEKEALRSRLYTGDDRRVRDRVLAAMSALFAAWRAEPLSRTSSPSP